MSDLPDFTNYSQVDLIQQTIAFLTNRPMYGEAKIVDGFKIITAKSEETLFSISGKGKIYTGIIFIFTDHSVKSDIIELYIDDDRIFSEYWETFWFYGIERPDDFVAWLSCYDESNHIYTLSIKSDITFEESFKVKYRNNANDNVKVSYKIIYALLQV